ncbi:MAG: hypothetical protein OEM04_05365 [Flavobacteriaceae bacterium]|nr:hypothetical protein [Flavobacteriaceae bacterium]
MNTAQIKIDLIQKIARIQDANLLERIQVLLNTSGSLYNEKINDIPSLSNNKESEFNDREDFTDYIKEWVKDM